MVYLFHGEDVVAGEQDLSRVIGAAVAPELWDLALTRLDGASLTVGALIEHCGAAPFLTPYRVVIVEGLAARLERGRAESSLLAPLQEYLPRMPGTTVLAFRERTSLAANHPLVTLVKKLGEVREFAPPKGRELSRWIVLQVGREECEITPAAADLLAATAGTDPAVLRQEISKLVTYVGPQGRIDERLVTELASSGRLHDIFALVDAIGARRRAQAMVELRRLLEAGQHALYILSMVVRQFRLLLEVKALPAGDRSPETVARTLKLHPFVAEKVAHQAQAYGREELEQLYHRLLVADQEIKTGRREAEVALELAVVEVSGR
jgi:DNA polymerase-3 subunit delta